MLNIKAENFTYIQPVVYFRLLLYLYSGEKDSSSSLELFHISCFVKKLYLTT